MVHIHYVLCRFMLQKLFALVDGMAKPDNADALQNHEILLPGHLLTIVVKVCFETSCIVLQQQEIYGCFKGLVK